MPGARSLNIGKLNSMFEHICVFESNREFNTGQHIKHERIIAVGKKADLSVTAAGQGLQQLQEFIDSNPGWKFGYLSYDLKNEIEDLSSENKGLFKLPLIHFFCPQIVMQFANEEVEITYDDTFFSENEIKTLHAELFSEAPANTSASAIAIENRISRKQYLEAVGSLKEHIRKGDIYEVNFCQEFFAECRIDPPVVYQKLNAISSAPFSAYARFGENYLLCASPERFLRKTGRELISQPIKGTGKRSENREADEGSKRALSESGKERSENIMIVDLVRNDLSKIATRGSVEVTELCKIYSYKQVHQMISTVRCELKEDVSFTEIIRSTFPMGSMTGAPKVRAMELIEEYESSARGLYSGSIGYIAPNGDFDFNVVIRSILYNENLSRLSFMVGSAITDKSVAEEEYEECLLKARAMFEVLGTKR